jgi:hypothetical protein
MKTLAIAGFGLFLALCVSTAGCTVETHDVVVPSSTINFDELANMGYTCGGPLTGWTVTNTTTGDAGNAGCEQPIQFQNLDDGRSYTFNIQGYNGGRLCWSGSCTVPAYGSYAEANCEPQIAHLCGF